MKAIKYLFLGALTLSFSAPVSAQEESPVEAVKALIESNAPDAEKQIKAIYKKNKKDMFLKVLKMLNIHILGNIFLFQMILLGCI